MKILVLGASGMAGHVVASYLLERQYDVDTLSGRNAFDKNTTLLDLTDKAAFENFLSINAYDAIINCVGILVNQSEERKDLASYLNGFLPHFLERKYQSTKTKIIHISTDCVYSGSNPPYTETSPCDGTSFYDRSKALGEIDNNKDLTFRMSIIGPEIQESGTGLFHWFMKQTSSIHGYTNAIWSGITTLELAKGIEAALKQDISGIYHLVPTKNISKYDLLQLFKSTFDKDIDVQPGQTAVPIDKTLINTRTDFNFYIPDYETMISDMRDWMAYHKTLYHQQYKEQL